MHSLSLLLPLILGLAIAGPAQAADAVPCQETTITLQAQADAWIDEDGAFSNRGSDSILTVRSAVPNKNARALVRFPIPAAAPPGCVVEFAGLRMFASSGDEAARLEAARLAFGWSEALVSWSNQPGTVGPVATAWGGDGYVQWNVRSQVQGMLESANHGLVIRDAAESAEDGGDQSFHSREKGENPPELVIRFAAPATEAPAPPAPPTPAAVSCGQELTRSVVLTGDLTNCPGDGLVIGRDRIIVDLGGHTIDGVGLGSGLRNDGHDLVTVRNGTIQDFDYGVQLLPETDLSLIERLSLHDNQLAAIELSDAGEALAGNEIRANLIERNGDGIALVKGTTATLVAGNTISLNGGPGLRVAQSDDNVLEGNVVSGSGDLGVALEHASGNTVVRNTVSGNSDGGIEIVAGSNGNRVEDNTVSGSGDTGILVAESERNELIGNVSHLMSDSGISLNLANDGVVRGNDVRFNPGGIQLDASSRNLIESNDATETLGIGIEVGGGSLSNHILRNDAGANGAQGIYVAGEALAGEGNLLERNVASGNASDGIVTAKGGHTLTFNVAHDNRGWGMHAAPGTIDGRGNVALRNTSSGQCSGIVCNADVTPPETSLGGAPVDPTNSAAAAFSFSGTDDRTSAAALRFQCRLDAAAFAACTSPRVYSGLAEGDHRFEVRAMDQAGNVDPSPAVHEWTVDRTPPETTIESGPADPSASRSASISFSGEDVDDGTDESELRFECRLDGGGFAPCVSPVSYADLSEGSHRVEVRAIDLAGNVDASPAVHEWTVDTTAPETSIVSGPPDHTNDRSARQEFESNEQGSRFECRLNDGEFVDCASPHELAALGEGTHQFEVRSIDRAGNVDGTPASHSWTVDLTPPETSVSAGPPDPSGSRSASISFAGEDDRSAASALRFECRLDDGTEFSACTSPASHAELAEGGHTFEVRAIDLAGNVDPSPATHVWTVDTTAPETTIGDRPPDPSGESSARFEFGGEDDRTDAAALRFECRLDDGGFAPCETGEFYSDLGEGEHRFEVRAIDLAGNVDPSPASHSWTVDTVAPETTIDAGPPEQSGESSARFEFTSNEPGSRFECRLDEGGFAGCETGEFNSDLSDGEHRFEVRAIDRAGNVDASPASHSWTVDTVPPETSIDSGPSQHSASRAASFEFSASEAGSRFECRLDDEAEFGPCSSPATYADLSEGEHRFEVRAIDRAGNMDMSPAIHSWTVDTTAPETSVGDGPQDPTNDTAARFEFSANEPNARFECRLDEGAFSACETGEFYSDLADGEHRFEVRAIDRAGNVDASAAVHSWTVDTVAPDTSIGERPADPSGSRAASFSFAGEDDRTAVGALRFECRLDHGAFADCDSPRLYTDLSDGEHRFVVRAVDRAGNVDGSPASHVWTVDTVAPETSLGERPPDPSGESSARFEFTSSEPASRFECRLDDGAFAGCETGEFYSDLGEGEHRFVVRAIDPAGNADGSPASYVWTVDTIAPATQIVEEPPDPSDEASATFEFEADEPGSSFECRLDDAAFTPCESPRSYTGLEDGEHRFEVRATDSAGNVDGSPAAHVWTVDTSEEPPADTTAPQTTLGDRPATPTTSQSATFTFAGTDDVTAPAALRFECRLDDSAFGFTDCSSPRLYSNLAEEVHTFEVRAVDAAGNPDASPATHTWTIDRTAPETTIASGPAAATTSTSASFTFTASEQGSTFECSLDNAAFTACTSPRDHSGLSTGNHQFRVRARDALGNVDASPAVRTWTIDTSAPQTTIDSGPPSTTGPNATLTFSSNEPGATFECSLDNAAFAPCTSPKDYTGLSGGSHQFRVRARDAAGNVDSSPASRSWTVDATAPQTTIGSGPPASTSSTSATFTFTANETGSTFQCRVDSGSFEACTSPRTYQGLSEGPHTFAVRATDARGNQDQSPATQSWTITPPPTGCVPSTVTTGSLADSWVLQSSSSTNYGTDSTLKVDSKNGGNARALVRLTLPNIPPGCAINDAKLRLYAGSYKTGRTLQALRIAASWTETTVRWNNQPATTGTAATAASASGYVQWTVTQQVRDMYSSGNNGFLVRDAAENGNGVEQGFNSREKGSDNPPRLVVTFGNP